MTSMYLYLGIAALGALAVIAGAVYWVSPMIRRAGSERVELPLAPLQKRARWGLGIGVVWLAALLAVTIPSDPVSMMANRGERLLFTGVLLGGMIAYLLVAVVTRRQVIRGRVVIDERDRLILARAGAVQSTLVLVTLAAWAVALTETYWSEGAIPVAFAYLIFWSAFIVHMVSYSLGILIGYARENANAEV